MAVYTQLSLHDINLLCQPFGLGEVTDIRGIEDGIENSTYFVDFAFGSSLTFGVLTVFEYTTADELPPFIHLMGKLAKAGLATPSPYQTTSGEYLLNIEGKPGLLFPRAKGGHVSVPTAAQCAEIGEFLARMHITHRDAPVLHIANRRGIDWQRCTAKDIHEQLPHEEQVLIARHFAAVDQYQHELFDLPRGMIHADLFHDNALFHEGRLSAVIDYYFACDDWFMLDVAIVANDWCWREEEQGYDSTKLGALIAGYLKHREISALERKLWPVITQVAMMRFWLSRRKDEIEANGRRLKSAYPLRMRLEYLLNNPADLDSFC